jgi:hypothetical protein
LRTANYCDREICCTGAKVKSYLAGSEFQVACSERAPMSIQPKTHQAIQEVVDARNSSEQALDVEAFTSCITKFFF